MNYAIKGPSGFDEARKEPIHWEACRTKGGWFAFRSGWETWTYAELTHPDTEWRRIPAEPMRFEARWGALAKDNGCSEESTAGGVDIRVYLGKDWYLRPARIIVEEVPECTLETPCAECGSVSGLGDTTTNQPDPPAEMTAEQAMEWLRGGERRYAADNQGDAWQLNNEGDTGFELAGTDAVASTLSEQFAPYTPLAPVTRGQMARVEELEKLVIKARNALQDASEALKVFTYNSLPKHHVDTVLQELVAALREATKEGAGG